jgi:hypothetical protein
MIQGDKLKTHILAHCIPVRVTHTNDFGRRISQADFYKVVHPLHVFKKVHVHSKFVNGDGYRVQAIANLIIPVGALIYAANYSFWENEGSDARKMRASAAEVHSIATVHSKKQVSTANSPRRKIFKYTVGLTVTPELRFSRRESQCESGIHFFVNLADAKGW